MRWYMNMILQLFYGVPLVYQKLDVICDMGQESASVKEADCRERTRDSASVPFPTVSEGRPGKRKRPYTQSPRLRPPFLHTPVPTVDGMVCEVRLIVLSSFLEYNSLIMAAI